MQKLNRNHLKLIACATMLADHAAAVLSLRGRAWFVMRMILGRIAFPLFGFLLVEGFFHTKSKPKYLLRLFCLGVLSEVPYDYAFHGKTVDWSNQNILFLLSLALLMLGLLQQIRAQESMHIALAALLQIGVIAASAYLAWRLNLDYDIAGICMIAVMYYTDLAVRGAKEEGAPASWAARGPFFSVLAGSLALIIALLIVYESTTPGAILAAVPAFFYSGKRGLLRAKYAFYLFYPVHITVLLLIARSL